MASKRTSAACRDCDKTRNCLSWTIRERERNSDGADWTETTGQCDYCLTSFGPDEHSDPPEAQDEAEAREGSES